MTLRARRAKGGPGRGYIAWWRADDLLPFGDGNPVDTWLDRTGNYALDATGSEGTLRENVALGNDQPGVEGGSGTLFTSTTTIDFSATSQVHAVLVGISGTNADSKMALEHSSNSGSSTNGFGIFATPTKQPKVQCSGNIGRSSVRDSSVAWSTALHVGEGRFDKGEANSEARLRTDGNPGNVRDDDADNTDPLFSNDFLYVFGRDGNLIPWEGIIFEIILYDEIKTGKNILRTYDYLEDRYARLIDVTQTL